MNWGLFAVMVVFAFVISFKHILEFWQYCSDRKFAINMQAYLNKIQTKLDNTTQCIDDNINNVQNSNIAEHHKERLIGESQESYEKCDILRDKCESIQKEVDKCAARAAIYANKTFFWKKEKMALNWHKQTM